MKKKWSIAQKELVQISKELEEDDSNEILKER
jgi:hypothetical protein